MGAATQWLFNFVITKITPAAINSIGWRTFLMFGVFCTAMLVFVFFFVKETKGRTLESMDVLFGAVDESQRAADVEIAIAVEKGFVPEQDVTEKRDQDLSHIEHVEPKDARAS